MSPTTEQVFQARSENLAFIFQEVLTAIVRLRSNRQPVSDAQTFRAQMNAALRLANQEASKAGYSSEAIRAGLFAVVAFVDESVLDQQVPIFADWVQKPLQEELFGVHVAGEVFFENLQRILRQVDSAEKADVLEVYQLCLLMGFRGRYSSGAQGELRSVVDAVTENIRRTRGKPSFLSPAWQIPPQENMPAERDPWARPIFLVFLASLGIVIMLFVGYRLALG